MGNEMRVNWVDILAVELHATDALNFQLTLVVDMQPKAQSLSGQQYWDHANSL